MLKTLLSSLFGKKEQVEEPEGSYLVAQLNEKIMPIDRGLVYGDPLDEYIRNKGYGEVTGGGTLQEKTGEIIYCDIEICLSDKKVDEEMIADITGKLESLGAPKGSKLIIESTGVEVPFGLKEGLALYLDGQNLPSEIYASCDINHVLSELLRLTGKEPGMERYWEGETETAVYLYDTSFDEMRNAISEFIDSYPLCQGARVVQIA
jgi:hypothetical protein